MYNLRWAGLGILSRETKHFFKKKKAENKNNCRKLSKRHRHHKASARPSGPLAYSWRLPDETAGNASEAGCGGPPQICLLATRPARQQAKRGPTLQLSVRVSAP